MSLEISLRVTGQSNQGGRKYMEDAFVVAYQQTDDKKDLEYAFFGIFDGHGGKEAALYAKNNLLDNIVNFKNFWQDDDELVLKAIRDGFLTTHLAMWKEVDNWPKTSSGLPSTAGTTASIAFIRKGKLYTGHVGDSRIVLGVKEGSDEWQAECLTTDHKPECPVERQRIVESGGLVMNKSGVERVVWKRPRPGHQGPVLRSTDFDEIPFLAVARSLGDLWSYDYFQQEFVVSPEPDLGVMTLDLKKDVCLILATDGLWNMMSGQDAVSLVQDVENENRNLIAKFGVSENTHLTLCNPSKVLVDCALERWNRLQVRADNTSVVTVMLDLATSSDIAVGKEQLTLKMNYTRSLQVWNVTKQSKNAVDTQKESSDASPAAENDSENHQPDLADFESKSCSTTKMEQGCSSQSENDRHTSSPLQSCSNFLPEYFSSGSSRCSKKSEIEGIENSPCPFPRWSKSASGRTSLSKLATWSKVVSHRRMSDPFPHRNMELAHSFTDDVYSLSDDEDSDHCFHSSYTCDMRVGRTFRQNDKNSLEDVDSNPVLANITKSHLEPKNSSSYDKIYKTALDQLCTIKQAIKRKYPGTEISQSYIGNSENLDKFQEGSSQKRKPDLINLSTLKVANILLDSES